MCRLTTRWLYVPALTRVIVPASSVEVLQLLTCRLTSGGHARDVSLGDQSIRGMRWQHHRWMKNNPKSWWGMLCIFHCDAANFLAETQRRHLGYRLASILVLLCPAHPSRLWCWPLPSWSSCVQPLPSRLWCWPLPSWSSCVQPHPARLWCWPLPSWSSCVQLYPSRLWCWPLPSWSSCVQPLPSRLLMLTATILVILCPAPPLQASDADRYHPGPPVSSPTPPGCDADRYHPGPPVSSPSPPGFWCWPLPSWYPCTLSSITAPLHICCSGHQRELAGNGEPLGAARTLARCSIGWWAGWPQRLGVKVTGPSSARAINTRTNLVSKHLSGFRPARGIILLPSLCFNKKAYFSFPRNIPRNYAPKQPDFGTCVFDH